VFKSAKAEVQIRNFRRNSQKVAVKVWVSLVDSQLETIMFWENDAKEMKKRAMINMVTRYQMTKKMRNNGGKNQGNKIRGFSQIKSPKR